MYFSRLLFAGVVALGLSTPALGSILIDFEGIPEGASVMNYYNGGTDSQGNSGTNYGISFQGGKIVYDQYGAHIAGGFSVRFNPSIARAPGYDGIGFAFLGNDTSADYSYVDFYANGMLVDRTLIGGLGNPYCSSKQDCLSRGYNWINPTRLDGFGAIYSPDVNFISFGTDNADDLVFGSNIPTMVRREVPEDSAAVPEPATYSLIGLGLFGLAAMRKKVC